MSACWASLISGLRNNWRQAFGALVGLAFAALFAAPAVGVLVMSVVFMAFAVVVYATHVNWKTVVTGPAGLQAKVQSTQDKIKQLQRSL